MRIAKNERKRLLTYFNLMEPILNGEHFYTAQSTTINENPTMALISSIKIRRAQKAIFSVFTLIFVRFFCVFFIPFLVFHSSLSLTHSLTLFRSLSGTVRLTSISSHHPQFQRPVSKKRKKRLKTPHSIYIHSFNIMFFFLFILFHNQFNVLYIYLYLNVIFKSQKNFIHLQIVLYYLDFIRMQSIFSLDSLSFDQQRSRRMHSSVEPVSGSRLQKNWTSWINCRFEINFSLKRFIECKDEIHINITYIYIYLRNMRHVSWYLLFAHA